MREIRDGRRGMRDEETTMRRRKVEIDDDEGGD